MTLYFRWIKKVVLVLSAFLVLFLLILAFLPTFISSHFGSQAMTYGLEKFFNIQIKTEKISISWLKKQHIQGLELNLPYSGYHIQCDSIDTEASLLRILFLHDVKDLKIETPVVATTSSSLEKPVFKQASLSVPVRLPFSAKNFILHGNICIHNGKIEFSDHENLLFNHIEIKGALGNPLKNFDLLVKADLSLNGERGEICCLFQKAGLNPESGTIDVSLKNLPSEAIDALGRRWGHLLKEPLTSVFGPTLNADCQVSYSDKNSQGKLSLLSEKVEISAELFSEDNQHFKILSPLKINASFTQELAHHLLSVYGISLPEGGKIDFSILSGSVDLSHLNALAIQGNFSLEAPRVQYQGHTLGSTQLSGGFSKESSADNFNASIETSSCLADHSFSFTAEAEVTPDLKLKSVEAQLLEVPLKIFHEKSAEIFGSTLTATLSSEKTDQETKVTLTAFSPFLNIEKAVFTIADFITLDEAAEFSYQKPPAFLKPLTALNIEGFLETFSLPSNLDIEQITADLKIQTTSLICNDLSLEPIQAKIGFHTLKHIGVEVFGPWIDLKTQLALQEDFAALECLQPIDITLHIDPLLAEGFLKNSLGSTQLLHPADVNIHIEPFSLNFLESKEIDLNISTTCSLLGLEKNSRSIFVTHNTLKAVINTQKASVSAQWIAHLHEKNGIEGVLTSDFSIENWDLPSGGMSLKLKAKNFPTAFIEMFIPGGDELCQIVSPLMDVQIEAFSQQHGEGLSIHLKSDTLGLDADFGMSDHKLFLKKPLKAFLNLSKEGFAALDGLLIPSSQRFLQLKEASAISLSVENFELPIERKAVSVWNREILFPTHLHPVVLNASLDIPLFAFTEQKSQREVIFEGIHGSISKSSPDGAIEAVLKTDVMAFDKKREKDGAIDIVFRCSHPFGKDGSWQLNDLKSRLECTLNAVPTSFLDLALRYGRVSTPSLQDFFGPTLDAKISTDLTQLSGPLEINIHAQEARLYLSGFLDKGTLKLKESLVAQLCMSKKMSRFFLNQLNPLGIDYIETAHPITLSIDPSGFNLPLYPYNPQNLNVRLGRLELGQVQGKSRGSLKLALDLLRVGQLSENQLALWFTPLDFSVKEGILELARGDILVNDFLQLALWGKLNLVQEKADMVLGLTSEALEKAFSIQDLPSDYVLHIPIKGSFDNIQVDGKKAASKIATILALQQGGELAESYGSTAGDLIGGFLKSIKKIPDSDKVAPSSKNPLPWQIAKQADADTKKAKEKRAVSSSDSPLKQLMKILF